MNHIKLKYAKKNSLISVKLIFLYTLLLGGALSLGFILKNSIGYLAFVTFAFLFITKKNSELVLFLVAWLYIYNFYTGQGWITDAIVSKYLIKGQLYVLITFFIYVNKNWFRKKTQKDIMTWGIVFLGIVLLSDILHLHFDVNFINEIYFIYLFFIIINLPKKKNFELNLFSLMIAVAIIQLVLSYMQVNQIISAPMTERQTITGQNYIWQAGLDDAASGSFGAGASNTTSWYETLMMLALFSYGVLSKKAIPVIVGVFLLFQYITIDSKTALGVTAIAIIYLIQKLKLFNLFSLRNIILTLFLSFFLIFAKTGIENYYNERYGSGIEEPIKLATNSIEIVFSNLKDWGKVAGLINISKDYYSYNPLNFIRGYGRENFNYTDNYGRIESMDIPVMKLNNITRSRSSFISMYGKLGVPGIIMLIVLFIVLWKGINLLKFSSWFGESLWYSGRAFLLSSAIFMFIYGGHTYRDQAFLGFLILAAVAERLKAQQKIAIIQKDEKSIKSEIR